MSTFVYIQNIKCIFSETRIKQSSVLTLSDIFRALSSLMSGPVKPVFASPTGLTPEHTVGIGASGLNSGSLIDSLITRSVGRVMWSQFIYFTNFRHSFPDDVSKAQTSVQREEHAKRMKSLRKELEYLDKTNWQYEPIEKLIGQS